MLKEDLDFWRRFGMVGATLFLMASPGLAEPFQPQVCAALVDEQVKLTQSGVVADRERGPDWAKANLPPERIKEILHSIEVDEQLLFRCRIGGMSVTAKRVGEQADNLELNVNAPVTETPPTAVTPTVAAEPKKNVKNQQVNDGAGGVSGAGKVKDQPKPAKKAPAKPKPKPNDAYSPPAKKTGTSDAEPSLPWLQESPSQLGASPPSAFSP